MNGCWLLLNTVPVEMIMWFCSFCGENVTLIDFQRLTLLAFLRWEGHLCLCEPVFSSKSQVLWGAQLRQPQGRARGWRPTPSSSVLGWGLPASPVNSTCVHSLQETCHVRDLFGSFWEITEAKRWHPRVDRQGCDSWPGAGVAGRERGARSKGGGRGLAPWALGDQSGVGLLPCTAACLPDVCAQPRAPVGPCTHPRRLYTWCGLHHKGSRKACQGTFQLCPLAVGFPGGEGGVHRMSPLPSSLLLQTAPPLSHPSSIHSLFSDQDLVTLVFRTGSKHARCNGGLGERVAGVDSILKEWKVQETKGAFHIYNTCTWILNWKWLGIKKPLLN